MGIKGLMSLIREKAPDAIKELKLDMLTGNIVACDAPMAMYQFLVMTQGINMTIGITELTDKEGNRTGHLVGLLHRTIQFLDNGIKPVWIFDGEPPELKYGEIQKRKKAKEEAKEKYQATEEQGNFEEAYKIKKGYTVITEQMKLDCMKMLRLMGVPVIEAPSEAEAQCVELVKAGKVYAAATEDMDALTFGAKYLLRGFNNKGEPILEIDLDLVLKGFDMTYEEFIDLCILCGCDYTGHIQGIGPITAFNLMKEHETLDKIIPLLKEENESGTRKRKYIIPDPYPYVEARELFKNPDVEKDMTKIELKWRKPDEQGLTKFLVEEKGFNDVRVQAALKKLIRIDPRTHQSRLDSFFGKPITTKRKENPAPEKEMKIEPTKKTKKSTKK